MNVSSLFCLEQGVDYRSGQYNVTIPINSARATLNISIVDDNLFEGDEEFYLTIDKSLSFYEIIIGSPNRAIVKIFDNEGEM